MAAQDLARGALQSDVREQAFRVKASEGTQHPLGVAQVVEIILVEILGSSGRRGCRLSVTLQS